MKFRLLAPHVTPEGAVLDRDTDVGDDSPWPWKKPNGEYYEVSTQMMGLDEDGKAEVEKLHKKLYGAPPPWDNQENEAQLKARKDEEENQKKLDEGSEPVSEQQRLEREADKDAKNHPERRVARAAPLEGRAAGAQPLVTPTLSSTARNSPTRGGDTSPARGPATPRTPQDEAVRPTKPNEEQYPKDG